MDPAELHQIGLEEFEQAELATPAFVYDLERVVDSGRRLSELNESTSVQFTYSIKACALPPVLSAVCPFVRGFSVSSLYEARLVHDVLGDELEGKTLHVTSPAYPECDVEDIAALCDFIVFNSLSQYDRFRSVAQSRASAGLRINPELSFIDDSRYDPCRRDSKLGVPLARLGGISRDAISGIDGLHFHSNSGSSDLQQLHTTALLLRERIPELLANVSWVNMGGGYCYAQNDAQGWLEKTRDALSHGGARLFMEPGEYVVGEAGYLATRVLDVIETGDLTIAIVDGTINHVPECFEYQFEPDALGHSDAAECEYMIAGASCLSGDIFGTYRFSTPIKVGDLVVFSGVGAYSTVKSSPFTGIPLPAVYVRDSMGRFSEWNRYGYDQYLALWTED